MRRKSEIEAQIKSGYFKSPDKMSVEDYFRLKFFPLYAQQKWKFSTFDTNMTYWNNDIFPYFGKMRLSKITPTDVEKFFIVMRGKKIRNKKGLTDEERPFLSETTIRYVFTLVNCFFRKAVQWDDIEKKPVKCDKPGIDTVPREFWQPEMFEEALNKIGDELLRLAVHIAFRCTLRIGEVCALNWNDINYDDKTVTIKKTLQRVTLNALDKIAPESVFHVYPPMKKMSKSRLIITTPKSDLGNRVNILSDQLCDELKQWELKITMDKVRQGEKYNKNNLVFCYPDGRPLEPKKLTKRFSKWQSENGIGDIDSVDFHSIRISSTSLKLAVSGGDIKSAQKDLGDKTTNMVLSTYARSLDTQHEAMNEKFDQYFYGDNYDPSKNNEAMNNKLLLQMMTDHLQNPEFLETVLKALGSTNTHSSE